MPGMKYVLICALSLVALTVKATADYAVPPPTFDAKTYTIWDEEGNHKAELKGSRKAMINVPFVNDKGEEDTVHMFRVDLMGKNAYDRGYAHGYLLAKEIIEFAGPKLDKFYMDMVLSFNLDTSKFPPEIQKIFEVLKVKGATVAPEVFNKALAFVWDTEKQFQPQYLISEMDGIADGMCASPTLSAGGRACDPAGWAIKVKQVNMLPELIRMACTAFGAWGKATATGNGLIQLRALDFGEGPFANYTVLQVHRENEDMNPFVSISFPAMVGVVTGVSKYGIGVSEKVWMTYDKISIQPGSYNGEADVFVLRDILQQAKSRADAEAYLEAANRTWSIWIGIGDHETQEFDLVGYKENESTVYSDVTTPAMTGQPYLEHIAYVDKHPQPSHDGPNGTLPTALTDFYGDISLETTKVITQFHETGDLHIASYDFSEDIMYVAVGRINHKGEYGPEGSTDMSQWKAYNRPYLKFTLADLWAGV